MRRAAILVICLVLVSVVLTGCSKSYAFVASKNSAVFHKPSCPWAAQIHDADKVGFDTRDAAIKAGYSPDPTCNP